MPSMDMFAAAIAVMEGARQADGNYRYNNPGNIDDWNQSGFQLKQFGTPSLGFSSLYYEIKKRIDKGYTLYEFFAGGKNGTIQDGYAPAGHGKNNPSTYSSFVGGEVGIPTNVPLNSYGWTDTKYFVSNPQVDPRAFIEQNKGVQTVGSGGSSGSETPYGGNDIFVDWTASLDQMSTNVMGELERPIMIPWVNVAVPLWGIVLGGVALLSVAKR